MTFFKMNIKMKSLKISVLCLVLAQIGCSRSKTVSTSNGEVKVEQGKNAEQSTVTFTDNKGEKVTVASEGGKLPDDYPKDAPVVGGAKVIMASATKSGDINSYSLVLESPDSFDNTVAFYKKELGNNKWKSEANVSSEKMTILTASKDTRNLVVQVTEADGKCSVTQTLTKKS
jgi:hypothetical protein